MRVTETLMSPEAIAGISGHARNGRCLFGAVPSVDDPDAIADWVDSIVFAWQDEERQPVASLEREDLIGILGFSWGEQIVAVHGWQWVNMVFHEYDDWETIAVVSPDRSLMILPFAFIYECLDDGADVTIGASLRVIGSDAVPTFPPNSYTNLMHGLRRIVPRA
jgi:hypothetical protein